MAAFGWIRPPHTDRATGSAVATLLRWAACGEPLRMLLGEAASEMLDVSSASRAGVWLFSGAARQFLEGIVVESDGASVPAEWRKLDATVTAIRDLFLCEADEILLRSTESSQMQLEMLSGTAQSLCMPLRVMGSAVGLAIVAWRNGAAAVDTSLPRALADVIALAAAGNLAPGGFIRSPESSETTSASLLHMREIEAQLAGVAESTDAGIVLFDSNGNPGLVNERFAQMLGISWQSLSEVRDWDTFSSTVAGQFRDPIPFLARWSQIARSPGEASWDEVDLMRPASRILERFARPIRDAEGKLLGRLESYRDVTSERMVQAKLIQTEKMAGLGQLISGIAHELNNPLTSIMGYSQLLLGRRLTTAQAADGRLIYQEAERAARIVKNLLLFAREKHPERHPVNLNEIVERTLALRNYELRVMNIQLEQNLAPELPAVLADPAQLQQVLLNLIVNAEQAIRQGNGEGSIRIRTWRKANDRVALEISDSGTGIPADIIPRIFDPFFSTKPPGSGTGLGLSISYGIVHEHGGEIAVESQPGKGAKFTLDLPAGHAQPSLGRLAREKRGSSATTPRATHSGSVLVVEDEPTVAHLIADVLGEEGHPVEIILDGQDGLDHALSGHYDLLICDLRMPGVDGRAIYRELEAHGSPLGHQMIFVTGDTLAPHTLEFLESAGVPYLAKPFLVEELKAMVAQVLDSIEYPVAKAATDSLRGQTNGLHL